MSWLRKFLPTTEGQPQGRGFGFQVLKNTSAHLAIEPWFDFIVGINGRPIEDGNSMLFAQEIQNCIGRDVGLCIWSAKGQKRRDILLLCDAAGLGLTLQWAPLSVTEDVWHILDVAPNSPADMAGLLPYSDYIIGTPEGLVRGESGLGELVEAHMDRPLRLYVYNHEYDITRELTITPQRSWGGEGALGCVLGFGALHRIPPKLTEPPNAPGETLFESPLVGGGGGDYHASLPLPSSPPPPATSTGGFAIPAFSSPPQQPPPPPPPAQTQAQATSPGNKARHKPRHSHSYHMNASAMDDYMREGEQKSLEIDGNRSASSVASLPPPPPKRTGPPPPPRRTEAVVAAEVSSASSPQQGSEDESVD